MFGYQRAIGAGREAIWQPMSAKLDDFLVAERFDEIDLATVGPH
jgi:hypothetical protein